MSNIAALGMIVSILAALIAGGIGTATYGSYADKKSTDTQLIFAVPPLNLVFVILLGLFFVSASVMVWTGPQLWTDNGLSVFCLLMCCGLLLLIAPDTLTLDLIQKTYVRKRGWIPLIRSGASNELTCVDVERRYVGGLLLPHNIYLCRLIWTSKKRTIIARFKNEKEAQDFVRLMSERLRIPVSSE